MGDASACAGSAYRAPEAGRSGLLNWLIYIGCLAFLAGVWFGLGRLDDLWAKWWVKHGARFDPERWFVVRVSEAGIVCRRPDRRRERVRWSDLQYVQIVSTSTGVTSPDLFWLLAGNVGGCAIPWGATGEKELLARLQELPGFDNRAVIDAAIDPGTERRTCWRRSPDAPPRQQATA